MSGQPTFTRRRLLLAAAGLGLYAATRASGLLPPPGGPALGTLVPARERLAGLFNAEAARVVGAEYLRIEPDEASPAVLSQRIGERLVGGPRVLERAFLDELRAQLALAIDRDFWELDMVRLRGWHLARTEARLYALAALGD